MNAKNMKLINWRKMITSASNKRIKDIQKLKENKNIKKYGRYLVEGKHLVEEALEAKVVEEIVFSESFDDYNIVDSFTGNLIKVTDSVMKNISDTITTQGIIAVCRIDKKELDINNYSKVLILDKIRRSRKLRNNNQNSRCLQF